MILTSLWVVWHLTTADIFMWPTHRWAHNENRRRKKSAPKKSHFSKGKSRTQFQTVFQPIFYSIKHILCGDFVCTRLNSEGRLVVRLRRAKTWQTLILFKEGTKMNDFIWCCRWFWHNRTFFCLFFRSLISERKNK